MINKLWKSKRRFVVLVLCMTVLCTSLLFGTKKVKAATNLTVKDGLGYVFVFKFLTTAGQERYITIDCLSNSQKSTTDYDPDIYPPGAIGIGDTLLYVIITRKSDGLTKIMLPEAIGHISDKTKMVVSDGTMTKTGTFTKNSGSINFTFRGFGSGGLEQTSFITINKEWLGGPGITPLYFTLIGTTAFGTVTRQVPANTEIVVFNGEYTVFEGHIPNYRLIDIAIDTETQVGAITVNFSARQANIIANDGTYEVTYTNQYNDHTEQYDSIDFLAYKEALDASTHAPVSMTVGQFGFTVRGGAANGPLVAVGSNVTTVSGSLVDFSPTVYFFEDLFDLTTITTPGTYTQTFEYYIEEDAVPSRWSKCGSLYRVEVDVEIVVIENSNLDLEIASLTATPYFYRVQVGSELAINPTDVIFTNYFNAPTGHTVEPLALSGVKYAENNHGLSRVIVAGEFDFRLSSVDNPSEVYTVSSGASLAKLKGTVTVNEAEFNFPELDFDHLGFYRYTVSEINGGDPDWLYDNSIYDVYVWVRDTGEVDGSNRAIWVVDVEVFLGGELLEDDEVITFNNILREDDEPPVTGDSYSRMLISSGIMLMATGLIVVTRRKGKKTN